LKVYVEDLKVIESGSYPDQFLRPYVTEVNGTLINRIEERYSKVRKFTPSVLAKIANQFIVPDNITRGTIEIPHGWSSRRGRFVLILLIETGTGDRLKQVVMGYTNSVGFSTRHIDHDMEFYVNNTFMLVEKEIRTASGRIRRVYVPQHTNDVLSDRENSGLRRRADQLYTLRPEDVFSSIDASQTMDLVDDLTDLRTTLSKNAIKSRTSNRLGSRFMSSVLDSRQKAIENVDFGNSAVDVNATAQGYLQESYASDDIFLRLISNARGRNNTVDWFTFRDLLDIDPEAERRSTPYLLDNDSRAITNYVERDERVNDLGGQEEWDRVAALIGMAVPALMLECGINGINFQVHNQEYGHQWAFIPQNARSLLGEDVDITQFVDKFEERLIDELLIPITADNDFDIGLNLKCRAFGEIDFTMFWNGADHGRFVYPCFTNSLSSPIITDSKDDVKKMSKDFSALFDEFLPGTMSGGGRGFSF
jgi:hypothetical protein